ncbi:bifunctional nicotinamidase/pyrazinamidase [Autumnicola musiva]|uniref:nicotinamidase n=1 Tax=Autumnicola musiva TaxID=3075589 RepID=A0ABU3D138_9FLAO|nr:bifunctional nicotinamidase/pyrazinamidase [Zunongwangia sp. F117]MDT0675254.1 bifunctional nicotinamidase/pyrazinamidase [Zunongwangia sp. F117]
MKALLIIDVQNDFMPGGALAVPEGDKVVPVINDIQGKFDLVIATQDWHPKGHASFAVSHPGKQEFEKIGLNDIEQVLWPAHCVQNTEGAAFHKDLKTSKIEAIFRKGTNTDIDSYSGFYDNAHLKSTGLSGYLKEKGVKEIYFGGLAAEICVFFSIKDALEEGFSAILVENATRALDKAEFENTKKQILAAGGKILDSSALGF